MELSAVLAGLACGILTGLGIGGGSLLMVWMTAVQGLSPAAAAGINLLYFLPASLSALTLHIRHQQVVWRAVLPAAVGGCAASLLGLWLSRQLEGPMLRKIFGGFLILLGLYQLCKKQRP